MFEWLPKSQRKEDREDDSKNCIWSEGFSDEAFGGSDAKNIGSREGLQQPIASPGGDHHNQASLQPLVIRSVLQAVEHAETGQRHERHGSDLGPALARGQ